ncbi:MAG: hypothetical protein SCARUB_00916 [Candidatus Scalindua rubra]|uniref:Uncharacterized protein n=1 Tax=Candidatus Scalindua rubra TaxID=1872076 RepID=A0A1E3XE95_9BACT|nr:MAG: hypothetical protein SCARUB_00916 [Candidatus Scalindua rubra]
MKTTELYVEQVLIGFFVIGIVILLATHGSPNIVWDTTTLKAIVGSTGLLAIAYLAGIVYDRCADTLLKDIEQHNRLRVGLKDIDLSNSVLISDPFPEQDIRTKILAKGSSIVEYLNYLRSRMRLTRSLATLVPALGLIWVLWVLNELNEDDTKWKYGTLVISLVYGIALMCKIFGWTYKPPETYELKEVNNYIKEHCKKDENKLTLFRKTILFEPVYWGIYVLTISGWIFVLKYSGDNLLLLIPCASIGLTLLIGWCWWRISRTFFSQVCSVMKNPNLFN